VIARRSECFIGSSIDADRLIRGFDVGTTGRGFFRHLVLIVRFRWLLAETLTIFLCVAIIADI